MYPQQIIDFNHYVKAVSQDIDLNMDRCDLRWSQIEDLPTSSAGELISLFCKTPEVLKVLD
jgi:hypothetical protein